MFPGYSLQHPGIQHIALVLGLSFSVVIRINEVVRAIAMVFAELVNNDKMK